MAKPTGARRDPAPLPLLDALGADGLPEPDAVAVVLTDPEGLPLVEATLMAVAAVDDASPASFACSGVNLPVIELRLVSAASSRLPHVNFAEYWVYGWFAASFADPEVNLTK